MILPTDAHALHKPSTSPRLKNSNKGKLDLEIKNLEKLVGHSHEVKIIIAVRNSHIAFIYMMPLLIFNTKLTVI